MARTSWNKGLTKETNETLKRIGENNSKKMAEYHKNHPEFYEKSKQTLGRKEVKEKARIRRAKVLSRQDAWNKGLSKETSESIRKVSEKLLGRPFSEEHRKNLSIAKSRPRPWAYKRKLVKCKICGNKFQVIRCSKRKYHLGCYKTAPRWNAGKEYVVSKSLIIRG